MNAASIERLRAQRDGPRDGALLRFSLGTALLATGDCAAARAELESALAFDPAYSAAWKALGEACRSQGDVPAAVAAWSRGIEAAGARGDLQSMREMRVFLRRLQGAGG